MGRAKLPMRFIEKEKTRNITFLKRKKGLKKKAYELSTLCDVPICIIIYPNNNNNNNDDHNNNVAKSEAEIWPSSPQKVLDVLNRYILLPQEDQQRRALNLSDILRGKKKKAEQDLLKLQQKSMATKYPTWHSVLAGLDKDQLIQMASDLDDKCRMISGMINNNQSLFAAAQEPITTLDHRLGCCFVQPAAGGYPMELTGNQLDLYGDQLLPLGRIDMNILDSARMAGGPYIDSNGRVMSSAQRVVLDDVVGVMPTIIWGHGGGDNIVPWPMPLSFSRSMPGLGQDNGGFQINDFEYDQRY
ncbi:hypothetical protein Dimus_026034 [Dionaea muscipula]